MFGKLPFRYFKTCLITAFYAGVLLFPALLHGASPKSCENFYRRPLVSEVAYSRNKIAEALTDVPALKNLIIEMMADRDIPGSIKRIIKKALEDQNIEVVQLTDQIRKIWSVPSYTGAFVKHPTSQYQIWAYKNAPKMLNELAFEEIESDFKNTRHAFGLGVSDRPISDTTNDLIFLIHELAHVRMEVFLIKNWDRICKDLPSSLSFLSPNGSWVMNAQLRDMLHEKYAHESEFNALKMSHGKYFEAWAQKWTGFQNLSKADVSAEIGDMVARRYKLSDPHVIALAKEPISKILLGGKVTLDIQNMLKQFFNLNLDINFPSREEGELYIALAKIASKDVPGKRYRPVTTLEFNRILGNLLATPDGAAKANEIIYKILLHLDSLPFGREEFLKVIDSWRTRYQLDSMGWLVSPKVALTWPDIIRGSARTRILFEQNELFNDPKKRAAFELINLGFFHQAVDYPWPKKFNSFQQAFFVADALSVVLGNLTNEFPKLKRPIVEAKFEAKMLVKLGKKDWKSMLEFWQNLDVGPEFEKTHPNLETFWMSKDSVLDIYQKLKQMSKKAEF